MGFDRRGAFHGDFEALFDAVVVFLAVQTIRNGGGAGHDRQRQALLLNSVPLFRVHEVHRLDAHFGG